MATDSTTNKDRASAVVTYVVGGVIVASAMGMAGWLKSMNDSQQIILERVSQVPTIVERLNKHETDIEILKAAERNK